MAHPHPHRHDQPDGAHQAAHTDHHGHAHGHAHGHSHGGHGHSHGHHSHAVTARGHAFAIAIALNTVFVAVEFGYGFVANSTALMADAGHNLSDVLGLLLAWGASHLARKAPNARFTWGLRASTIWAALLNAVLLLVACGAIALEAVQRFANPEPVAGMTVMVVAAIGIVVNGFSAWLFASGSRDDINIRGAYLHMAADAAVSLGVVLAGLAMLFTGWNWLDPVVSLGIVLLIVLGTWRLLGESLRLSLAAVPPHIDVAAVEAFLLQLPGVKAVHDLHIWPLSTTEAALTVHLVTPEGYPGDAAMDAATDALKQRFGIAHSTLQIELGTTEHHCALRG